MECDARQPKADAPLKRVEPRRKAELDIATGDTFLGQVNANAKASAIRMGAGVLSEAS